MDITNNVLTLIQDYIKLNNVKRRHAKTPIHIIRKNIAFLNTLKFQFQYDIVLEALDQINTPKHNARILQLLKVMYKSGIKRQKRVKGRKGSASPKYIPILVPFGGMPGWRRKRKS